MAPFLTLTFAHHAAWAPAAMTGLFLSIQLLFLFSLAMGLLLSTIGTLAFDRVRKLVLAGVVGVVLLAAGVTGRSVHAEGVGPAVDRFLETPAAPVLLAPFEP